MTSTATLSRGVHRGSVPWATPRAYHPDGGGVPRTRSFGAPLSHPKARGFRLGWSEEFSDPDGHPLAFRAYSRGACAAYLESRVARDIETGAILVGIEQPDIADGAS